MNKQKQYFINGLILLIIALVTITTIPYGADKLKLAIEKSSYSELEFVTLTGCCLFYLFSPKYYKNQILSIVIAFIYYFAFVKIFYFL